MIFFVSYIAALVSFRKGWTWFSERIQGLDCLVGLVPYLAGELRIFVIVGLSSFTEHKTKRCLGLNPKPDKFQPQKGPGPAP